MAVNVFFNGDLAAWGEYLDPLREALAAAGIDARVSPDIPADEVDYIVYGSGRDIADFSPFTRAKAVLRLWAGVEGIVDNPTLGIPLARMVGGGLDRGMVEWVSGHTLRHHLGMDAHIHGQDGKWRHDLTPPLAEDRPVTILGLGALGTACAEALRDLGFPVTGWSRTAKAVRGVRCLHGPDRFHPSLRDAQIVVLLTPATPATENLLDAPALAQLAQGAIVLNPGRGTLIDDDALLAALETGRVAHATLDTFRIEPLPPDHPFWTHPRITVTPHIASETRPRPAARVIAENIRRGETGAPFLHLVDRAAGY